MNAAVSFHFALEIVVKKILFLGNNVNYAISQTEKCTQTQDSFEAYVKDVLLPELDEKEVLRDARNPILFFVDGHASHCNVDFFFWCRENHIHIIKLLPNATRILQMCDVGMFGPAKSAWLESVRAWKSANKNEQIDEVNFIPIFKETCGRFIKETSIKSGFRATGWFPFEVENIHFDRCLGTSATASETTADQNTSDNDLLTEHHESSEEIAVVDPMNGSINVLEVSEIIEDVPSVTAAPQTATALSHFNSIERDLLALEELMPQNRQLIASMRSQLEFMKNTATALEEVSVVAPLAAIENILIPPQQFKRSSIHKNYKMPNSGVMTSDKALEAYEKVEAEKV